MSQMQAQAGRDGYIHGSADHACTSLLLRKPGISKGTHADHTPPTSHEYHYSPSNQLSRGASYSPCPLHFTQGDKNNDSGNIQAFSSFLFRKATLSCSYNRSHKAHPSQLLPPLPLLPPSLPSLPLLPPSLPPLPLLPPSLLSLFLVVHPKAINTYHSPHYYVCHIKH